MSPWKLAVQNLNLLDPQLFSTFLQPLHRVPTCWMTAGEFMWLEEAPLTGAAAVCIQWIHKPGEPP